MADKSQKNRPRADTGPTSEESTGTGLGVINDETKKSPDLGVTDLRPAATQDANSVEHFKLQTHAGKFAKDAVVTREEIEKSGADVADWLDVKAIKKFVAPE